jgi:hypothetical protein
MYATRISSLDHAPTQSSAKVTSCEECCGAITSMQLHILNTLDLIIGVLVMVFGIYMYDKLGWDSFQHVDVAWLAWGCLFYGILIFFSALLGFCGTSSISCRCCVAPSSWLGIIIALLSVIFGIMCFALKKKFYAYINDEHEDLGLSDHEVTTLKHYYSALGYFLMFVCILEIFRFRASRNFREYITRKDGEFDALLAEEEQQYAQRDALNAAHREDKYDNLRSYYKNKYAPPSTENSRDSRF